MNLAADEQVNSYALPPLNLLTPAPPRSSTMIDKASLERNARLLENVLDDFKVHGAITEVRPGPAVTMYELQLASGVKASSVTVLADDIARNMSAASARVVAMPGRNVIGIELPNAKRDAIWLHELIGSEAFDDQHTNLPIVFGKNIVGDPFIADLARMPHLLVAGTTGSGKSVGLNSMILSLLYKLTPAQCRMIMIDPKMLELTIYDDIPHLLSHVIVDPAHGVRAMKWVVEQMEDRYRQMSSVGVRSISSFNDKVRSAKAKGQPLSRKSQISHNPEIGPPVYGLEKLEHKVLPRIVVIIDELADVIDALEDDSELKAALHRVAERGAAAGVHMILASNRWEAEHLDELVGATGACRLAYPLADGDGAEDFLGVVPPLRVSSRGDMLYVSEQHSAIRIHGAFVSDEGARRVACHWRAQASSDYIPFVAQPLEVGIALANAPPSAISAEEQQYYKAIHIVCDSQNASTSWLQRQLRIGYNVSARLIDRMEQDGIVGQPDNVGRRRVLRDEEGRAIEPLSITKSRSWLSRLLG